MGQNLKHAAGEVGENESARSYSKFLHEIDVRGGRWKKLIGERPWGGRRSQCYGCAIRIRMAAEGEERSKGGTVLTCGNSSVERRRSKRGSFVRQVSRENCR